MLREDFRVDILQAVDLVPPVEKLQNPFSSCDPEAPAEVRVVDKAEKGRRKFRGIARRDIQACFLFHNDIEHSVAIRRHDGKLHRHRFDKNHAE